MKDEQVARISTNTVGNVVLTVGTVEVEMTPEHVDKFVAQLLHRAHLREHMFVIPVTR